jgi:hypothetical protein
MCSLLGVEGGKGCVHVEFDKFAEFGVHEELLKLERYALVV